MNAVVVPVVEGQTEQKAAEGLLKRIWKSLPDRTMPLMVPDLIRGTRDTLADPGRHPAFEDKLTEAHRVLQARMAKLPGSVGVVLMMLDSDDDCARELAARLHTAHQTKCPHIPFACVLAVKEFENWLVAGARGFSGNEAVDFPKPLPLLDAPEGRKGSAWLTEQRKKVNRRLTYAKTRDAESLIQLMDLDEAHRTSRSFRKLCKILSELQPPPPPAEPPPPE